MINGMSDTNDAVHLADNLNPAAERMFKWILSSDLAPGDPIPIEQDLATQFGMPVAQCVKRCANCAP
ncbi:transcriptional regulator [Cutibacterium acnes JCM 18920]|nr:transcriptional regulator [Cutibacterium acnes JCM 18920]